MRVIGLVDSVPWMTALANDEGYDRIFSGQIENLARCGDMLLGYRRGGRFIIPVPHVQIVPEHAPALA
jgi:D-sedoheptulose 7-phosphate isomerase